MEENNNTGTVHPHWEVKVWERKSKANLAVLRHIRQVPSKATSETTVLPGNVDIGQNEMRAMETPMETPKAPDANVTPRIN